MICYPWHMRSDHELDAPPWLRVESTIMSTARQIRCLYDQRFACLDLNLSQASLLAYVGGFGAKTQTTLADHLGLGRAATGTVIDQLEARGLLARTPDPSDRRVWLITTTASGDKLVNQISEIDAVVREQLRSGTTKAERQQLASVLVRIQDNLSAATTPTNTTSTTTQN